MEATISGRTGHAIQLLTNDHSSVTLEGKAVCSILTEIKISQVVIQVNFEVGAMEKSLNNASNQKIISQSSDLIRPTCALFRDFSIAPTSKLT